MVSRLKGSDHSQVSGYEVGPYLTLTDAKRWGETNNMYVE